MHRRYAIDTYDAGLEVEELRSALQAGWAPDEFVQWFAEKCDLKTFAEW